MRVSYGFLESNRLTADVLIVYSINLSAMANKEASEQSFFVVFFVVLMCSDFGCEGCFQVMWCVCFSIAEGPYYTRHRLSIPGVFSFPRSSRR